LGGVGAVGYDTMSAGASSSLRCIACCSCVSSEVCHRAMYANMGVQYYDADKRATKAHSLLVGEIGELKRTLPRTYFLEVTRHVTRCHMHRR
jgi:hypothetical protein